ncbi:polyhydroxyalkanoic acid system family protein [Hyphomicrobium sp.]|jgi:hypothetical protein|uniref:polyhydroxyalkanoic acid system family protein n=1 Tax=Hyphomicrobium sp. TaxID=82 RepID=UPI002BAC6ED0|nr:polyhydroxyalkanoic acid system family protein [Hyphomicrobium sp.]HVZ04997.1 polyhydroxyalkanoic acid system family protein [Hyphomicrobium sp.]
MSRPVIVDIPHTLGKDEAIQRLKTGFARIAAGAPLLAIEEEVWNSNQLTFKLAALGQSAAGKATVDDSNVRVEIMLPWFLQKLAEGLQTAIRSRGQILLEKK